MDVHSAAQCAQGPHGSAIGPDAPTASGGATATTTPPMKKTRADKNRNSCSEDDTVLALMRQMDDTLLLGADGDDDHSVPPSLGAMSREPTDILPPAGMLPPSPTEWTRVPTGLWDDAGSSVAPAGGSFAHGASPTLPAPSPFPTDFRPDDRRSSPATAAPAATAPVTAPSTTAPSTPAAVYYAAQPIPRDRELVAASAAPVFVRAGPGRARHPAVHPVVLPPFGSAEEAMGPRRDTDEQYRHSKQFPPPPPPRCPKDARRNRSARWYYYAASWDITHTQAPPPQSPLDLLDRMASAIREAETKGRGPQEVKLELMPFIPYKGDQWLDHSEFWFRHVQNSFAFPDQAGPVHSPPLELLLDHIVI